MAKYLASSGVLAMVVVLGFLSRSDAQDQLPPSFVELLKVGSNVGVVAFDKGGPGFHILFFTDRQETIAKDANSLSTSDLSKKYPEVKKLIEERLAAEISDPKNEHRLADIVVRVLPFPGEWATIKYVGMDYVAVHLKRDNTTEVIPLKYIYKVSLDRPAVQLGVYKKRQANVAEDPFGNPFGK